MQKYCNCELFLAGLVCLCPNKGESIGTISQIWNSIDKKTLQGKVYQVLN